MASAVAVRAILGIEGKRSFKALKRRYSGLKSCPQLETQCASSYANKETRLSSRSRQKKGLERFLLLLCLYDLFSAIYN